MKIRYLKFDAEIFVNVDDFLVDIVELVQALEDHRCKVPQSNEINHRTEGAKAALGTLRDYLIKKTSEAEENDSLPDVAQYLHHAD